MYYILIQTLLIIAFNPFLLGTARGESSKIPYPLNYCIISRQNLSFVTNPVIINYKNYEMKFCCTGCLKEYYTAPEEFLQKVAEATAKKD